MMKTKKILSVVLVVMMLMQALIVPGIAAQPEQFTDFPVNMWSTEAMTAAVANGLITGTSETTIEPTKNLTRAEFATIVARAFGATKTADISKFTDVKKDDWFYNSVAKVVQMGVMQGTGDTTFDPESPMKRENVILALARILFVDGDDTTVLDKFSDKDKIDLWSTKAIAGMVSEGYVNGYEDGTIRPQNYITREELAQLFHNMFKTYISAEGEYTSVAAEGSVIVRSKGVTLRDVTINGDLVLADGIGDGDFRLTNVTVKGKIIVRGGEGTVYFTNVKADGKVIINDPNGTVNFHNYRDEAPFRNNLVENTPATFLERPATGGSSVSGGGTPKKYSFYVYESYEAIENDEEPVVAVENKNSTYKIKASEVPTEIGGRTITGWYKEGDIELYERSDIVGKSIKKVAGNWYPIYAPRIFTVEFYDLTEDEPLVFTYNVPEGGKLADFTDPENENKTADEIKAELDAYLEYRTIPGYGKNYDDAYLFNEFEDKGGNYYENFGKYTYEHEINFSWYAEDDQAEYKLFDEDYEVTEDGLKIYSKVKKLNVVIEFPDKLTSEVLTINIPYEESTRFADSLRDALFINDLPSLLALTGFEEQFYERLADIEAGGKFFEGGSIFTAEYELDRINTLVRFSQLMGEDNFEKFLNSFITGNQNLMAEIEEKLIAYIKSSDHDATAQNLKELVDALIEDHEDDAHTLVHTLIVDLIKDHDGIVLLETFMTEYVTNLVNSEEQKDKDMLAHLEDMLCDMFASFRDEDPDAFKEFVTDTIVDSLSGTTPNATIKGMIAEYIEEMIDAGEFDDEIANGTFDDQIKSFILGMEPTEFIDKVNEVRQSNPTIVDDIIDAMDDAEVDAKVKSAIKDKILNDEQFRNTVIETAFDLNDTDVDTQIIKYVKDYNLAEDYIDANIESYVVEYIEDSSNRNEIFNYINDNNLWSTVIGTSYVEGSLTEQEKRDGLDEFIDNENGAQKIVDEVGVDEFKSKIDIDELIDDYFAANRGDVESKMKTNLTGNTTLREEFASYILDDDNYAKIKPYIDEEIEEAKDDYIDEYLDDYIEELAALTENDITPENPGDLVYQDKLDLVENVISYVRSDSSIITEAVGSDVIVDFVVDDIAKKENDGDPATKSDYLAYIEDYVDELDDGDPDSNEEFAEIVNKFIHADEAFRNDIIVKLFEELYYDENDPDHEILVGFMTKVTDDMIATGEIELGVLELIVEYVNDPKHGDELVHDIVEVLLQVDDIIDFATEHLGVVDNTGKLDAANKFKKEVTKEEKFEVTADNLFIMELVDEKVKSMTFDAFLNDFVAGKVPDVLLEKLPLYIVEEIYNNAIGGFIADLEAAIARVNAGTTEPQYVDSGVVVNINLIEDLFKPVMDYAQKLHDAAVEKAVASGNKAAELVEKYYVENPYVIGDATIGNKGVVNYGFDYNLYIEDKDNDGLYTIKSFEELYNGIIKPMTVESVDAVLWMMDAEGGNVPEDKVRKLAVENKDLILALYNHPNALMKRYAQAGLPDSMIEYYEDLLENAEIKAAVEKLDNNIDFDLMFLVEDTLQNKTIEMYFLKVLDRVGVKVEQLLGSYTGSQAYREFTEEQFDKIIGEIGNWWGEQDVDGVMIENAYGTTDYVFDTFFEKVAGDDNTASASMKGFEMTVTRFFADYLEQGLN